MPGLQMKYFVLRPAKNDWHGRASRAALSAYASAVESEHPELCAEIRAWVDQEEVKAAAMDEDFL
jgi:hypothetical protein